MWFGLVFWGGFALYAVDHHTVLNELARLTNVLLGWNRDTTANALLAFMGVCAVAAAALRTWASAYLSASVVHDARLHSERLVADGPYRHVRNPLYLGTLLLAFAFALIASRLGFAVIVVGVLLITLALIRTEEAGLIATQGGGYCNYLNVVPRLLPALRARVPASGRKPDWRNGIRSELYMWAFAAGAVGFAATQKLPLFWRGALVGVIILTIEGAIASAKTRASAPNS